MSRELPLNLLAFASQESYVRALVRTGHRWDVVPRRGASVDQPWQLSRTIGPSGHVVSLAAAREGLAAGHYALAVCFSVADLAEAGPYGVPIVAVREVTPRLLEACGTTPRAYLRHVEEAGRPSLVVYSSPLSRDAWAIDGRVIPPGIEIPDASQSWTGERRALVAVAGAAQVLPSAFLGARLAAITAGLPATILGFARHDGWFAGAGRWRWLSACRSHRACLHLPFDDHDDVLSWPMLEAMGAGVPLATTPHPACPVVDGLTGRADTDPAALRTAILELLEDLELAAAFGRAGQEHVADAYPMTAFVSAWCDAIAACASRQEDSVTTPAGPAA